VILQRFTRGQLAVLAWELRRRAGRAQLTEHDSGSDLDLRHLTGEELQRHLQQLAS